MDSKAVSILAAMKMKRGAAMSILVSSLLNSHYLSINASLQNEIVPWQRVSKLGEIVPSSQTGASAQIGTNICTIYNLEGVPLFHGLFRLADQFLQSHAQISIGPRRNMFQDTCR